MTSGRDQKELTGVSLLGNKTKYPTDYAPEVLETLPSAAYHFSFSHSPAQCLRGTNGTGHR